MNIGITITSVVVAFVFGYITRFVIAKIKLNSTEIITHKLLQSAREQADNERKTMLSEANSEIQKERNRLESENRDRKAEIQKLENRVLQREANLDKKTQYLENKEHNIENKMKKIKEQEDKLERLIEDEEKELERIAGLTKEEAKANLINDIEEDAKDAELLLNKVYDIVVCILTYKPCNSEERCKHHQKRKIKGLKKKCNYCNKASAHQVCTFTEHTEPITCIHEAHTYST